MFLTGTLLNVATVLIGTLIGVLIGSRMHARMQQTLTTGLGLFTVLVADQHGPADLLRSRRAAGG